MFQSQKKNKFRFSNQSIILRPINSITKQNSLPSPQIKNNKRKEILNERRNSKTGEISVMRTTQGKKRRPGILGVVMPLGAVSSSWAVESPVQVPVVLVVLHLGLPKRGRSNIAGFHPANTQPWPMGTIQVQWWRIRVSRGRSQSANSDTFRIALLLFRLYHLISLLLGPKSPLNPNNQE